MRSRRALAAAALACMSLVGCASTAQVGDDAADLPGAGGTTTGASGSGSTGGGTGGPLTGGSGTGGTTGFGGGTGTTGTTDGASTGGVSGTSGGALPGTTGTVAGSVPGVTDTTIRMGYLLTVNGAQRNATLGFQADPPPTQRAVEALTKEINSTGGIAGRKLVPVAHEMDSTSTQTFDAQAQEACTDWTEDKRVYVAVAPNAMRPNLRACLLQHRTIGISSPVASIVGDRGFQANPLYYETSGANLDRVGVLLADGLHALGYYKPIDARPMKIGMLRADSPDFDQAAAVYRRALSAHKLKLDDEVAIVASQSTDDAGRAAAELQSAVLRFRANGITHVVMFVPDAGGTTFFIRFAQGQNAQWRYGLTSNDAPQVMATQPDVQASQLRGALATGWVPVSDVAADKFEPMTAGRTRCEKTLRKYNVMWTDRASLVQTLQICDYMFFLRAVLGTAKIPITRDTFAERAARVGQTFQPGVTFASGFSATRRWGALQWRGAGFVQECQCFRYIAPLARFPGS